MTAVSNARTHPVPDLTPGGRLARIGVRGVRPPGLHAGTTTGLLSLSTSEISSLELTVVDQNLEVLSSGVFAQGAPVTYGKIPLTVVTVEVADSAGIPTLDITCLSRGASKVRSERGELVRRTLSPTDWVRIGAAKHGLAFVGEPSPSRVSITRPGPTRGTPAPSEYDFWQTLAGDIGFICFESMGVVYFGRPTWLMDNLPKVAVAWPADARVPIIPNCRRTSTDLTQPVTVNLTVADSLADQLLPGVCADLTGVPSFDHHYIVTGCSIPIDDSQLATVNAASPVDPNPSGAAGSKALGAKPKTTTSKSTPFVPASPLPGGVTS